MSAALRLLVATVLALAPVHTAPTAAAVTPPPLDDSRLPGAGPPAPPRPTAQRDDCAAAPPVPPAAADPGQLKGIDLPAVWALTRGAGQTVAVIDTGVARHRRLPHLVPGGDYVSTRDGTSDCDGHGTIVAGIIGAAPDSADPDASPESRRMSPSSAIRQSSNKFRAHRRPAPVPASAMSRRWRRPCAPPPTSARPSSTSRRWHACPPTPDSTTARWVRRWPTPSTSRTSSWSPRRATSAARASARGHNPRDVAAGTTSPWW